MKLLPETFKHDGFIYKLERRNDHAAIYRQHWIGGDELHVALEVVLPRIRNTRFVNGTFQACEPYETYPRSEEWGQRGWTFTTLEKAVECYDTISSKALSCRNARNELVAA